MPSKRTEPCVGNCGGLVYVQGTRCRNCYLADPTDGKDPICSTVLDGKRCTDKRRSGYLLCPLHLARVRQHGDASVTKQRAKGAVAAELKAAAEATTDDCIIFEGYRQRPVIRLNGQTHPASRAVWISVHGDPGDLEVLHSCNGGSGSHGCINIRHLRVDTHTQNMQDMIDGGNSPRGEAHGLHKLTTPEVLEMRQLWATGDYRQKDLAARFNVAVTTVSAIVHRRRWAWLTE